MYRDVGQRREAGEGLDMSEQSSEFDSEQQYQSSVAIGSSSANGVDLEEAVRVPDGSVELPVSTDGEPADASSTASEHVAEPSISGAADDGSVFVAELVRAMQTTAGAERVRISEDIERRRQAHVDGVRAREASEAERIRELAREDIKAIEAWADGEKERIKLERQRRMTDLHDDLDLSLSEHRAKIDLEVEAVETAIAGYRAEVDAFFERLDRETDLVLIAQQAAMRPVFPSLGAVVAPVAADPADAAEAEPVVAEAPLAGPDDGTTGQIAGVTERSAVGIMDPQAAPEPVAVMDPQAAAEPVESWAAPPQTSPEPVPAVASDDVDRGTGDDVDQGAGTERAEPVPAVVGSTDGGSGSLLQSMAVKQPMGWLRRHANGGDQANGES
jgi:hypothetical protein